MAQSEEAVLKKRHNNLQVQPQVLSLKSAYWEPSKQHTDVAVQLRAQAKQCLIKHEFDQAEQLLSQGLQLTPGSYKLLRLRSVAFACLQQYQRSLAVRS